jgi:hypothetical protein
LYFSAKKRQKVKKKKVIPPTWDLLFQVIDHVIKVDQLRKYEKSMKRKKKEEKSTKKYRGFLFKSRQSFSIFLLFFSKNQSKKGKK